MDDARIPRLNRHARLRQDPARDGWALVVPEGVVTLNPSAVEVLQRCDGRSVNALVLALAREFPDAPEATLREDAVALLERLVARGYARWDAP